ncbi:hypothetical protein BA011_37260 (plasmid) [Rhizobium leguminosarum]|uniref:Uncharacterized protein n=1 Tax=Rhizobium leguminosarum TaxID=384 RepID=A0A1B1CNC0_RHILE|nr:hypothetical protein BA011_37260 [Rhizobium leguminosarum]
MSGPVAWDVAMFTVYLKFDKSNRTASYGLELYARFAASRIIARILSKASRYSRSPGLSGLQTQESYETDVGLAVSGDD